MTIKVGDQYIEKYGGAIITVVKVLITEDEEYNLIEYVIFDTNENHAIPSYKLKQLCVKVVQSETKSEDAEAGLPVDKLCEFLPTAKWIVKDGDGHIYLYESKPTVRVTWDQWVLQISSKGKYVPVKYFPEVYDYFADIPWDESLTEL